MSDYKPMTPDRIFEIIEKRGRFEVHRYSYRDEQKRRVVSRLVKKGKLKCEIDRDHAYYTVAIEARDDGEVK